MSRKRVVFKLIHRPYKGEEWKELVYATKGRGRVLFRFPASQSKDPAIQEELQKHLNSILGRGPEGV